MLEQVGHDITIISSSVPSESIISGGYKPSLGYELAMEEKLKENIKSLASGGLIVSFGGGFNAYYAALLASKSRLKLWLMFRGSDANISKWNPIESYYNKFVVDCASEIFALSKEIADNVQLFSSNKLDIHVIPNSASRKSEQIKSISSRHITLGTGATHLNEKKGISHLLEMVAVVNRTMKDLHLSLELVGHVRFCVITLRQFHDKNMNLAFLASLYDLFYPHTNTTIRHILGDGSGTKTHSATSGADMFARCIPFSKIVP